SRTIAPPLLPCANRSCGNWSWNSRNKRPELLTPDPTCAGRIEWNEKQQRDRSNYLGEQTGEDFRFRPPLSGRPRRSATNVFPRRAEPLPKDCGGTGGFGGAASRHAERGVRTCAGDCNLDSRRRGDVDLCSKSMMRRRSSASATRSSRETEWPS